jgi:hypothetical protein
MSSTAKLLRRTQIVRKIESGLLLLVAVLITASSGPAQQLEPGMIQGQLAQRAPISLRESLDSDAACSSRCAELVARLPQL